MFRVYVTLVTLQTCLIMMQPGCRFLTRLLLVHGQLSTYRLSRLIKYSFYKNVAFGFLLFFYQFYNGFSGQVRGTRVTAMVP